MAQPFPVIIIDALAWPMFWVGLATAVGTIAAAAVATALGVNAAQSERRRLDGYAIAELNRQAELQAVLVRVVRVETTGPNASVITVDAENGSDKPISRLRIGARVAGDDRWEDQPKHTLKQGEHHGWSFQVHGPTPGEWTPLLEFTDAYRRTWQIDGNTLTLVAAADVRGTSAMRESLNRLVGS